MSLCRGLVAQLRGRRAELLELRRLLLCEGFYRGIARARSRVLEVTELHLRIDVDVLRELRIEARSFEPLKGAILRVRAHGRFICQRYIVRLRVVLQPGVRLV